MTNRDIETRPASGLHLEGEEPTLARHLGQVMPAQAKSSSEAAW
jgi:hypothetical protein